MESRGAPPGSEVGDVYRTQPAPVRAWLRAAFERLDSVAVVGESLRSTFDGLVPPERIAVVRNGTPDPHPPERTGDVGVFLSQFRRRKGVLEAMRAALMVIDQRPSARFVFAGEARDESVSAELRLMASRAGGQIELRGVVTGDAKRDLLRSAAFLLFPPVEPEGHPRVVLEAIAAGIPVVATDRGAIAETIIDAESGYVVPEPDPALLAERMGRLFDDRALRASMGRAARSRYLEHFTQEAADAALVGWLESVTR